MPEDRDRRPSRAREPWSDSDDAELRLYVENGEPLRIMAAKLGRTKDAVSRRINRLQLRPVTEKARRQTEVGVRRSAVNAKARKAGIVRDLIERVDDIVQRLAGADLAPRDLRDLASALQAASVALDRLTDRSDNEELDAARGILGALMGVLEMSLLGDPDALEQIAAETDWVTSSPDERKVKRAAVLMFQHRHAVSTPTLTDSAVLAIADQVLAVLGPVDAPFVDLLDVAVGEEVA